MYALATMWGLACIKTLEFLRINRGGGGRVRCSWCVRGCSSSGVWCPGSHWPYILSTACRLVNVYPHHSRHALPSGFLLRCFDCGAVCVWGMAVHQLRCVVHMTCKHAYAGRSLGWMVDLPHHPGVRHDNSPTVLLMLLSVFGDTLVRCPLPLQCGTSALTSPHLRVPCGWAYLSSRTCIVRG